MNQSVTGGNHSYKIIEVVGTSENGSDDAVSNAIREAGRTLNNLDWFEVIGQRGHIDGDKVAHFQVSLKLGFRIES